MLRISQKEKRIGQSTVEYIVLVAAVIAVVILFVTPSNKGIQQKLTNTLQNVGQDMKDKSEELAGTHGSDLGTDHAPTKELEVDISKEAGEGFTKWGGR